MRVYIKKQGARIVKDGQRLLVKVGKDTIKTIFSHGVEQIFLFGNIELSSQSLKLIYRNKIDLIFFTKSGRYVGRLEHVESKNIFLAKKQFSLCENDFGLEFSRSVVIGKLLNQASLVERVRRARKKKDLRKTSRSILALVDKCKQCNSIESLRGYEGSGSALYFGVFNNGFIEDQGFRRRTRRPPTCPVNSLLSLLYTFLMNKVYAAIRSISLNPYLGHLHSLEYGRYSLVLDLMEEFRVIICDTLVLSLFNLATLTSEDFVLHEVETSLERVKSVNDSLGWINKPELDSEVYDVPISDIDNEEEISKNSKGRLPVIIKSESISKVIQGFERKLETEFFYEPKERKITYDEAILEQAAMYRKLVEGEISVYRPILLK